MWWCLALCPVVLEDCSTIEQLMWWCCFHDTGSFHCWPPPIALWDDLGLPLIPGNICFRHWHCTYTAFPQETSLGVERWNKCCYFSHFNYWSPVCAPPTEPAAMHWNYFALLRSVFSQQCLAADESLRRGWLHLSPVLHWLRRSCTCRDFNKQRETMGFHLRCLANAVMTDLKMRETGKAWCVASFVVQQPFAFP